MTTILFMSSQPCVDGSALSTILQEGNTKIESISIVTNSSVLPEESLPAEQFNVAFSFTENSGAHEGQLLAELYRSLKHGGTLTIAEKDHKDTHALEQHLVLAGFIDCKTAVSPTGDAMVAAVKPTWQSGSHAPLKLPKGKAASSGQASGKTLKIDDNSEDLIDEDALLTEEDRQRPAPEGQMEKLDLTPEMLENPQSGCGSCGLGDAFRCQSCPYRGLPSFERGKRIELPNDFLTADA